MNITDLLQQPWELQVALASGYAAYMLAYTGARAQHSAVEVAFGSLLFGLVATATLGIAKPLGTIAA